MTKYKWNDKRIVTRYIVFSRGLGWAIIISRNISCRAEYDWQYPSFFIPERCPLHVLYTHDLSIMYYLWLPHRDNNKLRDRRFVISRESHTTVRSREARINIIARLVWIARNSITVVNASLWGSYIFLHKTNFNLISLTK